MRDVIERRNEQILRISHEHEHLPESLVFGEKGVNLRQYRRVELIHPKATNVNYT